MMMEKFNTLEAKDLEPINLDKLNELIEYVDREQDMEDHASGGMVENVNDNVTDDEDLLWLDWFFFPTNLVVRLRIIYFGSLNK